jgi:superfamily II DNA or RNA helicase/HKD family nuclease/diadenosine tetraphosphate (Ap4A) HIT family hydrolase
MSDAQKQERCPFCCPPSERIILQEESYYAVWDGYPVSKGHALVISRRHVPTWFDATREERLALLDAIDRVREEILRKHKPDGFNIGINVDQAAGQTILHLHIHVIPRYTGDVPDPRGGVRHVIPAKANYLRATGAAQIVANTPHTGALIRGDDDALLPHLLAHIDRATNVDICVAFVQLSGLRLVQEHLRDLLNRGGRLRFLTGDYLDITDPQALLELLDLDGRIDLRVFETRAISFHPKSYIFHLDDGSSVALVGSSNLTSSALRTGVEWNYRVVTSADPKGLAEVHQGFDSLFLHPATKPVDESWVRAYALRRRPPTHEPVEVIVEAAEPPPPPHLIQEAVLAALAKTREKGNSAGLVVLATGLGKTWLSAYDCNRAGFERVLFVAHREEILEQALQTFRRIRPQAKLGRYNGTEKFPDADVLFASIQTLGKLMTLRKFDPKRFDYIVVDEFHHAAAKTYRNLIGHFTPKFLLGLTATPERTDGGDLLSLCQENLVYRCDMFEGIEQELLVPFHYFGVPDDVDYENIPWRSNRFDEEALTAAVATQKRAQNSLEQYQARAGDRTLAFCCSQRHADFMAEFFSDKGLQAVAVHSGINSAPRAASLEALAAGKLDVVFAVDMFNEGVDLPNVNTVMMLRPTESAILWMQQFGRGLRKAEGKSHLTVIDYIGNHRIFLNKPRTLLGLGPGDYDIDRALNLLLAGEFALPPGCEVTYDLAALDIIRSLLKRTSDSDALRAFYEDFRERNGVRPTASEAFHAGFNPGSLRTRYGSWLNFVKSMGDLSNSQQQALEKAGEFLRLLEMTPMTKSFKMLTLLAMLNQDKFPGSTSIDSLADGFQELASRSSILRQNVGAALSDRPALIKLIEENPIQAWAGGRGTGGQAFFVYEQGVFTSRVMVEPEFRESLQELARELADWRLAQYLSRPALGGDENQIFYAKVSHSSGQPMLFLPDRKTHPEVPSGWVPVVTDDGRYEANFVKIALNVVREPGNEDNVLPAILRNWFGPDAGKPGTNFQVVFERADDGYRMRPLKHESERGSCAELWRSYNREEIPALFGLKFNSAIWNAGFVSEAQNIFLLITLEKADFSKEHGYKDRFLTPDEFEMESQNRTTQKSKHGQMLRYHKEKSLAVHLFVRRSKRVNGGSAPFIYCGPVDFKDWRGERPITVQWHLQEPVPQRLHNFLKIPA